jgi:MFS family permease
MWRGTREGFAYARRNRTVKLVLVMMVVFASVSFNFNILLPVLAKTTLHGSSITFGLISACFGAGALLGALTSAAVSKTTWRVMLGGAAGFGVCELLIAPVQSVFVVGALLFLCGICFTSYTANSNAAIQLESPDYIRGRVLGLYYYAWNGLAPLGALLVGWLCDSGGTQLAFSVAGASALAVTAFAAATISRRRLSSRPAVQAEPAGEQLAA